MNWDSSYNNAIGLAIALAIVPLLRRGHQKAHEEAKRRVPDGILKFLVTHEFRCGRPKEPNEVRVVRKELL